MSEITKYYESSGNNPYTMEQWSKTSRVATLKEWVKKYTPAKGKVLDVGCGDMFLAQALPEYEWTGIDINPDLSKSKAVKQDLESFPYPFKEATFDTVICSEVLEHLFNPLAVNKEVKRLIKPSGHYIVSTPNLNWIDNHLEGFQRLVPNLDEPWTYEHIHYYTLDSHKQLFGRSGFNIIEFTGADAHFSPFFCRGREELRKALGIGDPDFTRTEQLLGKMWPELSHTIMLVAKSI